MSPKTVTRFWNKVDRRGSRDCWPWTAYCSEFGHGQFWCMDAMHKAHRVSFLIAHGRWPVPNCLHRCDNPPCVNPAHLYEGTGTDNVNDRVIRGRGGAAYGSANGRAKILEADAAIIRSLRGVEFQRITAARYGLTQAMVSQIQLGRFWKT